MAALVNNRTLLHHWLEDVTLCWHCFILIGMFWIFKVYCYIFLYALIHKIYISVSLETIYTYFQLIQGDGRKYMITVLARYYVSSQNWGALSVIVLEKTQLSRHCYFQSLPQQKSILACFFALNNNFDWVWHE